MLSIRNIQKSYGKHTAVDGVSFDMPRGTIFGLLGPNGAGKTSLIRIITTITRPDAGEVFFDEEPLNNRHPERIGYMPEERGLYKKMKVGEHLLYLAQLKGMSIQEAKRRIQSWLEKFEIEDWWDKKVEELSKGMQQKIQFIATVVHEPDLLILDEPFSGLDPINTNLIKDEIRQMHRNGKSIIFSTHRMEQVEEMCEYIVLISKGKNVLEGPVVDIRNQFKEHLFEVEFEGQAPTDFPTGQLIKNEEGHHIYQLPPEADSNDLLRHFVNAGIHVSHFREILPSLNEVFIKQVNEPTNLITHE